IRWTSTIVRGESSSLCHEKRICSSGWKLRVTPYVPSAARQESPLSPSWPPWPRSASIPAGLSSVFHTDLMGWDTARLTTSVVSLVSDSMSSVMIRPRSVSPDLRWSGRFPSVYPTCLLYTSDAADDLLCVDLGGRR